MASRHALCLYFCLSPRPAAFTAFAAFAVASVVVKRSRNPSSPNRQSSAFAASVQRAISSGYLRPDTDPSDFVRALVGIFHTTASPGWEPSARRLVDILIAGSRSTLKHPSASPRKRQK